MKLTLPLIEGQTPSDKPMMGCGHAANSRDENGKPSCVICIGIKAGARTVVETPDLSERRALCAYCSRWAHSSTSLAFFEYHPDRKTDDYYCGCRGWD